MILNSSDNIEKQIYTKPRFEGDFNFCEKIKKEHEPWLAWLDYQVALFEKIKKIKNNFDIPDEIFIGVNSKEFTVYFYSNTGGTTGGNYFSKADTTYTNEKVEFEALGYLLNIPFGDKITLNEFLTLKKTVCSEYSHSTFEYYGNSSTFTGTEINLEKLFDFFNEKGFSPNIIFQNNKKIKP